MTCDIGGKVRNKIKIGLLFVINVGKIYQGCDKKIQTCMPRIACIRRPHFLHKVTPDTGDTTTKILKKGPLKSFDTAKICRGCEKKFTKKYQNYRAIGKAGFRN